MGRCACKDKSFSKRAKNILWGREYNQVDEKIQRQVNELYHQQFNEYPTQEQIKEWLK